MYYVDCSVSVFVYYCTSYDLFHRVRKLRQNLTEYNQNDRILIKAFTFHRQQDVWGSMLVDNKPRKLAKNLLLARNEDPL